MWLKKNKTKFRNYKVVATKNYDNPFFKSKHKSRRQFGSLSNKFKIIVAVLTVAFLFLGWALIYSNIFKIKNIEIIFLRPNDISSISPDEIKDIVNEAIITKFIFFPKDNLILLSSQKIIDKIAEKFSFENIFIKKKLFNTLIVDIVEHEYAIIWHEGDKYYYISQSGSVISQISAEEVKPNFPYVESLNGSMIKDNLLDISDNNLEFIKKLYSENKARKIIDLNKFIYNRDSYNSMTIITNDGPELYFNTEKDIQSQILKLEVLKNEKLKDDFKNKTYIDLRYGDMVYYK